MELRSLDISPKEHNKFIVIDDDDSDVKFLRRAFSRIESSLEILHIADTDQVIPQLEETGMSCVLLDLKMPKEDGGVVLQRIKSNPILNNYPVIILSSSKDPLEIERCYESGANAYSVKPSTIDGYKEFAQSLISFWGKQAILSS